MANEELKLAGMTPSAVFEKLRDQGVDAHGAAIIVGSWIHELVGAFKRTFYYKTQFPAEVPECKPTFNRSFHHADWIDGESVVQAEKTTAEEGFNARFHKIEADLDALGRDVAHSYECMANMRGAMAKLLEEIRVELNRLSDIVDKPDVVRPTIPPLVKNVPDLQFLGGTKLFGKDVMMWNTENGMMVLPAVKDLAGDPLKDPRVTKAGDLTRVFTLNDAIRTNFANREVTRDELVDKFGTVATGDGRTVRDLVEILPTGAKYATLDALVDDVAEREAAVLRTSDLTGVALAAAFGTTTTGDVSAVPVERLESVPASVRAALSTSGISTIANLASADPAKISETLERAGVSATRSEVAGWVGAARTLRHLNRPGG
ncbi:MAG: hypothetical protein HOV81_39665 [Kofleriaceae bacterium]|nr:hypothetical protein [Kofleriaceae bacterium]